MSKKIKLTAKQTQKLHDVADGLGYSGAPVLIDMADPHSRVYVAAFDGTWNDRDKIPKGERPSIVADFERETKDTSKLSAEYIEGVGTRTNIIFSNFQGMTGHGALERAERAYSDFQKQVDAWRQEDPNIVVHVHTISFSRGGGSALHFLNMVHDKGAEVPEGSPLAGQALPKALQPGEVTSSATLLDTVVTGQRSTLNLGIPSSTLSVLQVTAESEIRRAFNLTNAEDPGTKYVAITGTVFESDSNWDLAKQETGVFHVKPASFEHQWGGEIFYPRVTTLTIPGVHSDIGGTYGEGGIRDVVKYAVDQYHNNLGFDVIPQRPTPDQINSAFAHESRWNTDKLLDIVFGKNERDVFMGKIADWDGTPKFGAWISESEHVSQMMPEVVGKPEQGFKIPERAYGVEHSGTFVQDAAGRIVLEGEHAKGLAFDNALDRVTFYGVPVESLSGDVLRSRMAVNGGETTVELSPEKHIEIVAMDEHGTNRYADLKAAPTAKFPTQEAALHDLLSDGLRQSHLASIALSAQELRQTVEALSSAEQGDKLVLSKSGDVALEGASYQVRDEDLAFDASSLRAALIATSELGPAVRGTDAPDGSRPAVEQRQQHEEPAIEAPAEMSMD